MTFRAKPVVKRTHKPAWESRDRRNFFTNIGFGLVVVAALVILFGAIALRYYDDNLASVGSVDGQAISRSDLRERIVIEDWRLTETQRRTSDQFVAGQLTAAERDLQLEAITRQKSQVVAIALERIIDNRIQANLATGEGISVTDADIDARLALEATTREARHGWIIEVAPVTDEGAIEPTTAQIAAARAIADKAVADLRGGAAWDEIARTISTDTATAQQAGDLGWLAAEDTRTDEAFLEALFAVAQDAPTDVIEGEDGIFRIGRVTQIAPESVDGAYEDKLTNENVDIDKYRAVVRGDVIRQKLEEKVVAEATKPGLQRDVREIYIAASAAPTADLPDSAVKVRHILYSPKDDPRGASSGDIPDTDPSWEQARKDADATFARLTADPALFDSIARTESDEQSARGVTGSGGKLGYITADTEFVQTFLDAVLVPDLPDGKIVGPFKTEFGWHIAQIMYHPTDAERMDLLRTQADGGAEFATLARDNSEAETAGRGGALGFIGKGQLDETLTDAIFGATIGKTSIVVDITGDGLYLYEVIAEETRTPEGRQLDTIKATAFADWYTPKKEAVAIERDPTIGAGAGAG